MPALFVVRSTQAQEPERSRFIRPAIYAGLTAALVSLIVETPIAWAASGETPWAAARMTAAMMLGAEVLPPPASFSSTIVLLAFVIHFALSIIYGFVLGLLVRRLPARHALLAGAVFGLTLYVLNLHVIAPGFFPWFTELQGITSIFSHLVFGAVLGGTYVFVAGQPPQRERTLFVRGYRRTSR